MKKRAVRLWTLSIVVVLISVLGLVGCEKEEMAAAEEAAPAEPTQEFVLVCQFAPNVLINRIIYGMDTAAALFNVKAEFVAPESGTVPDQVDLLTSVIAKKPDGIAILITEPTSFQESIKTINDLGIPWGTFNTGDPGTGPKQLFYVGASHYDSGAAIAQYVLDNWPLAEKPKRYVIVDPLPGHEALDARAEAIKDVMTKAGIPGDLIDSTNEQAESVQRTKAYLIEHPDTNVAFPIGMFQNFTTNVAIEELGKKPGVDIVSAPHDIDGWTAEAIQDGKILATSDQQMFMQGFMPIVYLWLRTNYGSTPPMFNPSGPAIYDKNNIGFFAEILKAVAEKYGES
jgi:simple sugar transport system substrate-binding protein